MSARPPGLLLLIITLLSACSPTPARSGVATGKSPAPPPPAQVWLELVPGPEGEAPRAEVAVLIKQGPRVRRHAVDELPGWPESCERRALADGGHFLVAVTTLGEDRWELEARAVAGGGGLQLVERALTVAEDQRLVEQLEPLPLPAGALVQMQPCQGPGAQGSPAR